MNRVLTVTCGVILALSAAGCITESESARAEKVSLAQRIREQAREHVDVNFTNVYVKDMRTGRCFLHLVRAGSQFLARLPCEEAPTLSLTMVK